MDVNAITPTTETPSTNASQVTVKKTWTIEDSEKLYRIQGWGDPYFSINAAGHVTIQAHVPSVRANLGGTQRLGDG